MKIGILTFHRAHNYGAVLQAYALVTYLINCGLEAEIVDYRPEAIEGAHGTIPWGRIKRMSVKGKIKLIVAMDENCIIGDKNELPWKGNSKYQWDMDNFKMETINQRHIHQKIKKYAIMIIWFQEVIKYGIRI